MTLRRRLKNFNFNFLYNPLDKQSNFRFIEQEQVLRVINPYYKDMASRLSENRFSEKNARLLPVKPRREEKAEISTSITFNLQLRNGSEAPVSAQFPETPERKLIENCASSIEDRATRDHPDRATRDHPDRAKLDPPGRFISYARAISPSANGQSPDQFCKLSERGGLRFAQSSEARFPSMPPNPPSLAKASRKRLIEDCAKRNPPKQFPQSGGFRFAQSPQSFVQSITQKQQRNKPFVADLEKSGKDSETGKSSRARSEKLRVEDRAGPDRAQLAPTVKNKELCKYLTSWAQHIVRRPAIDHKKYCDTIPTYFIQHKSKISQLIFSSLFYFLHNQGNSLKLSMLGGSSLRSNDSPLRNLGDFVSLNLPDPNWLLRPINCASNSPNLGVCASRAISKKVGLQNHLLFISILFSESIIGELRYAQLNDCAKRNHPNKGEVYYPSVAAILPLNCASNSPDYFGNPTIARSAIPHSIADRAWGIAHSAIERNHPDRAKLDSPDHLVQHLGSTSLLSQQSLFSTRLRKAQSIAYSGVNNVLFKTPKTPGLLNCFGTSYSIRPKNLFFEYLRKIMFFMLSVYLLSKQSRSLFLNSYFQRLFNMQYTLNSRQIPTQMTNYAGGRYTQSSSYFHSAQFIASEISKQLQQRKNPRQVLNKVINDAKRNIVRRREGQSFSEDAAPNRRLSKAQSIKRSLIDSEESPRLSEAKSHRLRNGSEAPVSAQSPSLTFMYTEPSIKGIRIALSGCLGRKGGMSKTLWKQIGTVPTHVYAEAVDFAVTSANTKLGQIGIRVLLCFE